MKKGQIASSSNKNFGNVCLHEMGEALTTRSCRFRIHAWIDMKVRKLGSFQFFPKIYGFQRIVGELGCRAEKVLTPGVCI